MAGLRVRRAAGFEPADLVFAQGVLEHGSRRRIEDLEPGDGRQGAGVDRAPWLRPVGGRRARDRAWPPLRRRPPGRRARWRDRPTSRRGRAPRRSGPPASSMSPVNRATSPCAIRLLLAILRSPTSRSASTLPSRARLPPPARRAAAARRRGRHRCRGPRPRVAELLESPPRRPMPRARPPPGSLTAVR